MREETLNKIAADIFGDISKWETPADQIVSKFFRNNRSINSRNRRYITESVYNKIRSLSGHPEWYNKFGNLPDMSAPAPVDLRVNTLVEARNTNLVEGSENTPLSPIGLRLQKRVPLEFDGRFEVQDEGSQLTVIYSEAKEGESVLDYCAGAGGKTLALAAQMNNKGKIVVHDANEDRMKQLPARIKRAGVRNVRSSKPEGFYDLVFVDAPCSGTGTWRRNPDLKWRFKETDLQKVLETQREILEKASKFVKVGGRMVYVTCSLLPAENEEQIDWFLSKNSGFKVAKDFLKLTPPATDGFFAAMLLRS